MGDPRTLGPEGTMDPPEPSTDDPASRPADAAKGRKSIDLYDVATLAKQNYEEEKISPLRQLRQLNDTFKAKERSSTLPKSQAAKGISILNNNNGTRLTHKQNSKNIQLSENVRHIMARRCSGNLTGSLRMNYDHADSDNRMKRHSLETSAPSSDQSVSQATSDEHISMSDEPFSVSDEQTMMSDECFTKRSSSSEEQYGVMSPHEVPKLDYYYTKPPVISDGYFPDKDDGDIFDPQGAYVMGSGDNDQEEWPPCPCPDQLMEQSELVECDNIQTKRKLPGVLQIPDPHGRLPSEEVDRFRDDKVIYDFTSPKPVIEVKLAKTPTRSGPKYALPSKRGTFRMSRSSEDILNDNHPGDKLKTPVQSNQTRQDRSSITDYHSHSKNATVSILPESDSQKTNDLFASTMQAVGDVMNKYDQQAEGPVVRSHSFHEAAHSPEEPDPLAELETGDCCDDVDGEIDSVSESNSAPVYPDSRVYPDPLPSPPPPSDMALSSPSTSVFSSSGAGEDNNVDAPLTAADVARVEMFYQSQGTQVVVCNCMAHLYQQNEEEEWHHVAQGVPVFVLLCGHRKGQKRELKIVLAEKGTGFRLWEDTINYLSNYRDDSPRVHTLQRSYNHMCRASFHMHSVSASTEFLSRFKELTADPNDELWKVGKSKKSKKKSIFSGKKSKKKLNKKDISQPCNFMHVTKVEPVDHVVLQAEESESHRKRCNTSDW